MNGKIAFAPVLLAFGNISTYYSKGSSTPSEKAIICLTYDDGLDTQLSIAIPQLDSMGLKATFFLNSILGSSQSPKIGQRSTRMSIG